MAVKKKLGYDNDGNVIHTYEYTSDVEVDEETAGKMAMVSWYIDTKADDPVAALRQLYHAPRPEDQHYRAACEAVAHERGIDLLSKEEYDAHPHNPPG